MPLRRLTLALPLACMIAAAQERLTFEAASVKALAPAGGGGGGWASARLLASLRGPIHEGMKRLLEDRAPQIPAASTTPWSQRASS